MYRIKMKSIRVGALEKFGKAQPGITSYMGNQISESFSEFLINRQMSGQTLRQRTGRTVDSVKFGKDRKNGSWWVRPGIGIRGALNYLQGERFERGARPFTRKGVRGYRSTNEASRIAVRIYNAMMKKIFGSVR